MIRVMRSTILLTLVLALAAASRPELSPRRRSRGRCGWRHLATPAATGSAQPQLSVSSRGALLSWVEKTGDQATLKFSERTAGGLVHAARPSHPAPTGSSTGPTCPPSIRLADGTLAAHWLQKSGPGTYAYDVRLSYSTR